MPWDLVLGLTPHIVHRTHEDLDTFTRTIVARMHPTPRVEGLELLPRDPRFLLVANHYQRKGLWILFPAAVITQAIRARYGPAQVPMRWVVTANWPPVRMGPWRFPSPGDWLLPRVAHALSCYPVAFAGANPTRTGVALARLLKDARTLGRPIGLFPEGVAGSAGRLSPPLPGVERLIAHLARCGWPAVPAAIFERHCLVVRFGAAVTAQTLLEVPDAAAFLMSRIQGGLPRS